MEWPAPLDEYEKLVIRMDTPRVVIDNAVCSTATLVKVDSARKHGIHLEAVQVLVDLNLSIRKAYISSDGRWFMDVFHVTDHLGRKLTDDNVISYLEQSLNDPGSISSSSLRPDPFDAALTALELTGTDRLGLLSEVFAVLADLRCSIVEAKAWTHGGRIAALIFLKDVESGSQIDDSTRIDLITARLRNVLNRDHDVRGAKTTVSSVRLANADRRLHQMMFADRDYEQRSAPDTVSTPSSSSKPSVSVQNWIERGYSVVSIQCRDRAKLLFDVVCTLTDMEYVVFHGTIDTNADRAYLEFYIRHKDGTPISSEAERQRVIQCLLAAIERRSCEGLRLELCAKDQQGLLAEVTRTFRENGLSVSRAEISTKGSKAMNTFYVTDASGHPADLKTVDAVVERIGPDRLKVVGDRMRRVQQRPVQEEGGVGFYYLGSIVKRNLYNLGLIRSCS